MVQLNEEKGVCNITSVYSPEYVRRRVLKTPLDTLRVGVSEWKQCMNQVHCLLAY